MSPPKVLDGHTQRIVVADDECPSTTLVIETLRLDGHRVTHVTDLQFAAAYVALQDCHLFICGPRTGGMHAVHLMMDLRDNMPDLPILCLAAALCWTRRVEGLMPEGTTILREPFTAERVLATVRTLLPLRSRRAAEADGTSLKA